MPCSSCLHGAVSWKSCWRVFFFCSCPASAVSCGGAWSAIGTHNRHSQLCTASVCRQCKTGVWCGSCLSHVQICVCVSGLVSLLSLPVSQQVLSVSVSVNSDQLTEQSSRCKFQLVKKNVNSCLFMYWTATRILHWDTTDILTWISQLLIGHMKQCVCQCLDYWSQGQGFKV